MSAPATCVGALSSPPDWGESAPSLLGPHVSNAPGWSGRSLGKGETSEKKGSEEIDQNHNSRGVEISRRAKPGLQKGAAQSGCGLVLIEILEKTTTREDREEEGRKISKLLP